MQPSVAKCFFCDIGHPMIRQRFVRNPYSRPAPPCEGAANIFRATPLIAIAQNCHLGGLVPAFWHPGGPLWHLGSTLGDHGSSRMETRGSGIRFWTSFSRFRDPTLRAFWVRRAKNSIFLSAFPGHLFYRILCRNPGFRTRFSHGRYCKRLCSHRTRKNKNGVDFHVCQMLGEQFLWFLLPWSGDRFGN